MKTEKLAIIIILQSNTILFNNIYNKKNYIQAFTDDYIVTLWKAEKITLKILYLSFIFSLITND